MDPRRPRRRDGRVGLGDSRMTICIDARPFVVRQVSDRPNEVTASFGPYEIRPSGWRTAAGQLGMTATDLDCVRVSRARSDLTGCPFCRHAAA